MLHLVAVQGRPDRAYPQEEVVAFALDGDQMARLLAYLAATVERDGQTLAEAVSPGLTRDSFFYPAKGRFHLLNTCNTWTAEGLSNAGLAVDPNGVSTSEDLMSQLRGLAQD